MITILGLLVATYAVCRLIQVPLELIGHRDEWRGMPLWVRLVVVGTVSVCGVAVLFVLTLMLLAKDSEMGRLGR